MNNKHQENGARTGPLIFTLPVFCLNLDWLDGTGWAAVFVETRDLGAGSAPICTAAPRRTPKYVFRRQRTNCCGALVTVTKRENEGFDNTYSKSTINHQARGEVMTSSSNSNIVRALRVRPQDHVRLSLR